MHCYEDQQGDYTLHIEPSSDQYQDAYDISISKGDTLLEEWQEFDFDTAVAKGIEKLESYASTNPRNNYV